MSTPTKSAPRQPRTTPSCSIPRRSSPTSRWAHCPKSSPSERTIRMRQPITSSSGLFAFVSRHRARVAILLLFLVASPASPDDRQLLQATSGAKTNVILILDSSGSMNNEFTDSIRLPAFMDDFLYPQGTAADTYGSKIALAKAVPRQVITKSSSSVNWAFSHYRKPNPTLGGAKIAGDHLTNGDAEWLYFADSLTG